MAKNDEVEISHPRLSTEVYKMPKVKEKLTVKPYGYVNEKTHL